MNKIKVPSKLYLWSIGIISANFFGLYNIVSKYTQIYYSDAIAILLIVVSCIFLLLHLPGNRLTIPKKRKVDRYAVIFLLWIVVEIFVSYIKYSSFQSIFSTIKESLCFIAPILVFYSLKKIITNSDRLDYFIDILVKISLICSVLAIISLVVYTKTRINILGLNIDDYSFMRNGRGHFMVGSMVVIPATIFLWCRVITGGYKISNVIILALNIFHVFYIGQTRMYIAILSIVMLLSYLVVSKRSKIVKGILVVLLLIILFIIGAQTVSEYVSELVGNNTVLYRLDGINYYMHQLIQHPVLGMGLIGTSNSSLSTLLYGPLLRYFRTDVGFVGFINCFGIFGGIWYLSYVYYCLRMTLKSRSIISIKLYEYIFSFGIFITLSSINLFPLDGYRLLFFSISMILIYLIEINQAIVSTT